MAGQLLLEDKRPLHAKLHTAHLLRKQKFMNAKPRLLLTAPPPDTRPLWLKPQLQEGVFGPVRRIQYVVSEAYGISVGELLGVDRTDRVVRPRHVAMYLSKALTRMSMLEIGRRFGGRDHSTVLHAVHKIERQCQDDPELMHTINNIKGSLYVAVD
jgi:hypothetical protein